MRPLDIIDEYYPPDSKTREILVTHSEAVAKKAIQAAGKVPHLNPDYQFIEEAAMLHDIGIFYTNVPAIGCYGPYPYVSHGYIGRKLLEEKGLNKHALVCERHVGVGLTKDDIIKYNLPVPERSMTPLTIEEKIVCYADKFFSKKIESNGQEQPIETVFKMIEKYGDDQLSRFKEWVKLFE